MPQYDTDPGILEERAYSTAMEMALTQWDPEEPITVPELRDIVEDIRGTLLEEYPTQPLPGMVGKARAWLLGDVLDWNDNRNRKD